MSDRRQFITMTAAQQQHGRLRGVRSTRSPAKAASDLAAFRQGLDQTGYFEGKNVAIEYRWYDRLPGWRLCNSSPA
jgi:putative ABC transport system substrate-binding protein